MRRAAVLFAILSAADARDVLARAHRTDCASPAYASVRPQPAHWQCAGAAAATFTVAHSAHRTETAPLWYAKRTRHPAQSNCDVRDAPPPSGTAVTVEHSAHRTFEAPYA